MLNLVLTLAIYALAVLLAAKIVPGLKVKSFGSAFIFAAVFAILNKLLLMVLVFFTFPLLLISFGLFLLVINAFLFWLADKFVSGVECSGFGAAFFGALVTSIINVGMTWLLRGV